MIMMVMMMMMMMVMNCFCGMVDRRNGFSLISSRNHCQRSLPSPISDTPRAEFEPVQGLSSGFVEWSCAVVITGACSYPYMQNDWERKIQLCWVKQGRTSEWWNEFDKEVQDSDLQENFHVSDSTVQPRTYQKSL